MKRPSGGRYATLTELGFDIEGTSSGEDALALLGAGRHDAVLLDLNMPGIGGIESCRRIRRLAPRVAILMLTVRDSADDKVEALEAGADDYVTKPFHLRELVARVRASVRRAQLPPSGTQTVLKIGEIMLDPVRRLVQKDGGTVHLTPKEFDLLRYLMTHAGLPLTHASLLRSVWGNEYTLEREYLRTYVRQLRKPLEHDAADPNICSRNRT